jgi:cell division protein FtsI/penicillin-binding protein 2
MNQFSGVDEAGNDVELTLDPELQRIAYDGLASSSTGRGAAVALTRRTARSSPSSPTRPSTPTT